MKKCIVILADGFEEIEAVTAIDILRRAGISVSVCGVNSAKIKGSKGIMILCDNTIDEIEPDYDACVLPGGMPGAENLFKSDKVTKLILEMDKQDKLIAGICAAPAIVLAPLGILDNKSAACYPGMQENFSSLTRYGNEDVIVDENIITATGPGSAFKFALAIVENLCSKEAAQRIAASALVK
jgi:protein deglycase